MDKVTLREAFKSIEDVTDEIFDAFEQPEVKVINKKKLNESLKEDACPHCGKDIPDYKSAASDFPRTLNVPECGKFRFDREYSGWGIYDQVSGGYKVSQSYAFTNGTNIIVSLSFAGNDIEDIMDIIDNWNNTGKFGVKMLKKNGYWIIHSGGKLESLDESNNKQVVVRFIDEDFEVGRGEGSYLGEDKWGDPTFFTDSIDEAKVFANIKEAREYLKDRFEDIFATGDIEENKDYTFEEFMDNVLFEIPKKNESLDESEQLDEKLPKDLAKAYRQAPVEFDRIGFTGVGSKYKDYDKYGVTLKNRDTRRNVKTDYANSEYKEITPAEALQAKKDGNISKLRILIDGDLVQYRNDGYPLVGPELYGDKVYTKKNGEEVNDTRRMPFNHVVNIADKIYLTDEDEHSIGKGGQEFDYETRQWKDIESDSVYNKRQSNKEIEDTGKHNKEKLDNWNRKQANSYKKYIADYKDKLAKLEQKWEAGDISKNEYENEVADFKKEVDWYTDRYKDYRKNAERDEQRIRNNKASRRYQVSANKLREPLDKLKELKRNIRWAKDELNDLEKSGLSSYRLSGGSYKEKQSEIAKLKAQIEQAQKRIEQLEKESQGLDDANAKQNADAIAKAQDKVNNIQNEINTLLRKNKNESLNLKESDESKDYNEYNAQSVLNNVEELIARNGSYNFESVYDKLSIFDWWPNRLSQNHLRQMRGFLKEAIKLGYTGYVCFKVGASGCANGMWAYKEPTTTGYSPDGDAIYRSFTPDYTYYSVCVDGKWYPGEDTNGEPYDSCKTTRQLEELISKFNGGKKESLDEDYDYDLCDKIAEVLDDYGIMYGDIVANEDGTVNIVGVDEDEWYEAQDAIYNELGYNVLVPDEEHEEFDDELIVTLDESCKKNSKRKNLKEATKVDIDDKEDVEKGKEILDKNKESDTEEEMQVVDVDADTVDKLKDSYIGNVLLQCPVCRTPIFKQPDKLVKDEENIADNPDDQLYNVGEQCPHCGQEKGFNLVGQVANMDVDAEEEDEDTTGEEEVEKEDNFEQTTEDDISEEPIEDETEIEDEEDVTFESLDIDKFNNITNTYLTEVYSNVESFTTTNATVDDENNKLIIEGIINYKSGKSKNTKFEFLGESITEDNKYIFKGLNETFAKDNNKAFTLKASIDNNTLISESLDYDYTVTNTKLNESKVVKGSTLK